MHAGLWVDVVGFTVATVSTAFGLKRRPRFHELRSQAFEHGFDHMVGSNAKDCATDLGRQMSVAQMPGQTRQLFGISMADLYYRLRSRLYFEPSPVMQPQSVSIGHSDRLRQIEEDLFALIRYQTNASTVTLFEIKSDGSRSLMPWPAPGGPMNRCTG